MLDDPDQSSRMFQGVEPVNVAPDVYALCVDQDGNLDHGMFEALHTKLNHLGMLDLVEIKLVHQTQRNAAKRNAQHTAKIQRMMSSMRGGR